MRERTVTLDVAQHMGERLHDACFGGAGTSPRTYLGIGLARLGGFTVGMLGNELVNGGSGIACVFAAMYSVFGEKKWREAARLTIENARLEVTSLTRTSRSIGADLDVDFYFGISGAIYALAACARFCHDDELFRPVRDFFDWLIHDAKVAQEETRDLAFPTGLPGLKLLRDQLQALYPDQTFPLPDHLLLRFAAERSSPLPVRREYKEYHYLASLRSRAAILSESDGGDPGQPTRTRDLCFWGGHPAHLHEAVEAWRSSGCYFQNACGFPDEYFPSAVFGLGGIVLAALSGRGVPLPQIPLSPTRASSGLRAPP